MTVSLLLALGTAAMAAALACWLLSPDRHRALSRLDPAAGMGADCSDAVDDAALAAELVAATLAGGLAVPAALDAVAAACAGTGRCGRGGLSMSLEILAGAAHAARPVPEAVAGELAPVADAVAFAQATGAPVVPLLLHAAKATRQRRRDASVTAAGRLAASLVLPLGLCALPGFLLLGIAPVVVRLVGSLG